MNLIIKADRTLIRTATSCRRHVLLSFTAPDVVRAAARPPVNVSFVIDRSGSMDGRKIELARQAVIEALRMLRPADRFSVICYDNEVNVLVSSTLASSAAVREAAALVRQVGARGSTDLGGGWLAGCEQIAQHLAGEQVGKCLLLSDGLANHGITDHDVLASHSRELRQRGVATSTFGIGSDFDERLLEGMAASGGGHPYFIEQPGQILDFLTSELGEALEIVARDVAVTVAAPEGVKIDTLNEFPVEQARDGRFVVRLGDLTARQDIELVLSVSFPPTRLGDTLAVLFGVTDAADMLRVTDTDLIWTAADDAANEGEVRNVEVDRAVAQLYAASAKAEALELNRAHRYDDAQRRLEAVKRRIERYAGADPVLREIMADLEQAQPSYAQAMPAMAMKAEYHASLNQRRSRQVDGKARRK